jgi:very-short-patch-repair endonuclease
VGRNGANPKPDILIARIAGRQYGVVSLEQLEAAGIRDRGRRRRVAAGRLHRIHRGVYAVGHAALSQEGRWMAAVLALGEGAALSHQSAAELWGIRRRARRLLDDNGRDAAAIDVTVPGTAGRAGREGIALHRSSTLTASDCTRRDGIPVTKPGRTLSDLRTLLSAAQFNAAIREAEFLRLPINQSPGAPRTRTELEQRFLGLCRRRRLPQPGVNARIEEYEVDFLWDGARLIVEVDGWESHRSRSAFEDDRARDARLALLGYRVVRFTWRQIEKDPRAVARTVRAVLGTGSS